MFPWVGDPLDLSLDLFYELTIRADEVRRWLDGDEDSPKAGLMKDMWRRLGGRK